MYCHLFGPADDFVKFRVLHESAEVAMSGRDHPHPAFLHRPGGNSFWPSSNLVADQHLRSMVLERLDKDRRLLS